MSGNNTTERVLQIVDSSLAQILSLSNTIQECIANSFTYSGYRDELERVKLLSDIAVNAAELQLLKTMFLESEVEDDA